jgi:hypothetical protein
LSFVGVLASQAKGNVWLVQRGNGISKGEVAINQTDRFESEGSLVLFGTAIQSVDVFRGDEIEKIEAHRSVLNAGSAECIVVDFSFSNPVSKMVLHYQKNIVDNIEFCLSIQLNPKRIVDPQIELKKNMKIRHSLGEQLINIYFQPANAQVEKTEIELYVGEGRFDNGILKSVVNTQLITRKSVDKDNLFVSINDLAFGVYSFRVVQKNRENGVISSSDFYNFHLEKPNYSGKHTVYL